ncbi:MAG: pilus assembly protein [Pirellulaceae bacterium]|nr:pilus assembly protein [Pirellulaceae bacterium]
MHKIRKKRRPSGAADRRLGIAVVELAVCLPVLALIAMATIEACAMLQLQQNASVVAYEGARIGILPGSDDNLVVLQCQMLLDDRQINNYTVSLSPPDPTTMSPGDLFQVTVSADCAANALFGGFLYEGKQISETVVMRAE